MRGGKRARNSDDSLKSKVFGESLLPGSRGKWFWGVCVYDVSYRRRVRRARRHRLWERRWHRLQNHAGTVGFFLKSEVYTTGTEKKDKYKNSYCSYYGGSQLEVVTASDM